MFQCGPWAPLGRKGVVLYHWVHMPFRFFGILVLSCLSVSLPTLASSNSNITLVLNRRIQPQQTLSAALHGEGLADAQVEGVIGALSGVFDFRRVRPGDQFRIVLRNGELDFFDYRQNASDEWHVRREGDRFLGLKGNIEVEKTVALVELKIGSSLYEAVAAAGEDSAIAMALSDVFAWDVDFYQDVRQGDRVRAVVEKVFAKGRLLRYGEVLAASYEGTNVGKKQVFRYELPDGTKTYFREDGSSARKTFLKSPLKYAHVTSRFGSRFHPILKYLKAHNGVDYGAPIGTPIWAVADGVVKSAGYAGGSGHRVCIRHINSFETCYLHLSRYGSGVRVGARVSQKQIIAYSGNSGLSTGPHLHFAMLDRKSVV